MAFKSDRQRKTVMARINKGSPLNKYKSIDDLPDMADVKTVDDIFDMHRVKSMSVQEAQDHLGDRPVWELKNMKRALSSMPLLNTPEDDKRLRAVTVLLKSKSKR